MLAVWYGIFFWFRGFQGLKSRVGGTLFVSVCLLRTLVQFVVPALESTSLALPDGGAALLNLRNGRAKGSLHALGTLYLTLQGLFGTLGAPFQACSPLIRANGPSTFWQGRLRPTLADGSALTLVGECIVSSYHQWICKIFGREFGPVGRTAVRRALRVPFLYGLFFTLRRPNPSIQKVGANKSFALDAAAPVTVLLVMNTLYFFFILVQFAALFVGETYLAKADISYAAYARSGFFQLVRVAILNLALVMACLHCSVKEGRGWRMVQILCTVLVAISRLMLISAAYRMTIYVVVYGLSFIWLAPPMML